ncbi:DUF6063 family protein [Natranaerofaba carboxydovora]|uniref:DUF6063 family protein n=1 Tax=Natranaerofaba carboxydovora TaxID=2742683 RepID=UPI001F13657A|nr:DUF6063 family protein [Natranaerofaba carboxydovora]
METENIHLNRENLADAMEVVRVLIEKGEISSNNSLYEKYMDRYVKEIVDTMGEQWGFEVVKSENRKKIYFSAAYDNILWGYTNERLRSKLKVKNNEELYCHLFALLCMIAQFFTESLDYDLTYLKVEEWEQYVTDKAKAIEETSSAEEDSDDLEIRFSEAAKYWLELPDIKERAVAHQQTDARVGILIRLARVLQEEQLLKLEDNRHIYLTDKFESLLKNHFGMAGRKEEIIGYIRNIDDMEGINSA